MAKGPRGDAFYRGRQAAQVVVVGAVGLGGGFVAGQVLTELPEPLGDEIVVLHLVATLLSERHLDVDLRRRRHPVAGHLCCFDLALHRQLQEGHDLDVAVGLGLERLSLTEL